MSFSDERVLLWFVRSWCRESSAFPELWSSENPALGQCLSTAWITHLLFGGSIRLVLVERRWPHFYNVLPTGQRVDFTRSQFPSAIVLPDGHEQTLPSIRAFARLYPAIQDRFECLRGRFVVASGLSVPS